jgi:CheY-like chemotaxis protein
MVSVAPLRVLVVDDSAYNRRNIADILGGADEVEVVGKAGDGEEALRLALAAQARRHHARPRDADAWTASRSCASSWPSSRRR